MDLASLTALLARNGFVAAEEEAAELLDHAAAVSDAARLATVASAQPPAEHRRGQALLVDPSLGGDQASLVTPDLTAAGFAAPSLLVDEDGDLRGIEARLLA